MKCLTIIFVYQIFALAELLTWHTMSLNDAIFTVIYLYIAQIFDNIIFLFFSKSPTLPKRVNENIQKTFNDEISEDFFIFH